MGSILLLLLLVLHKVELGSRKGAKAQRVVVYSRIGVGLPIFFLIFLAQERLGVLIHALIQQRRLFFFD